MLSLAPVTTHDVVARMMPTLDASLRSSTQAVVVDASSLTVFDSSALAILLQCRRQALAAGKTFAVLGAPARLRQLAQVYGVDSLIPAA